MAIKQPYIMFVLDNPRQEPFLRAALETEYHVGFCHNTDQALNLIPLANPHLVVIYSGQDPMLPLALAHVLRSDRQADYIGLIYCAAPESASWQEKALAAGVDLIMPVPADRPPSREALECVLRLCAAKQEVQALNSRIEGAQERLIHKSHTDEWSAFGHHFFLNHQLRMEFKRAQRYQKNLVLILISIDCLRGVNTGGLPQEPPMSKVGLTVSSSVRFEIDFTGRSRDGEFFVILPETDLDAAISVAERIRDRIAKMHQTPDRKLLTTSVGVVHFNGDRGNFKTYEELLHTAYLAVQTAHDHGGDQYCALDSATVESFEEYRA